MTAELVLAAVAKPGKSLRDLRNRAMLLIGFAGAFRRSELIGLDVADVTETDDGLLLHIRRSKTDQEGHGRKVAIPHRAQAILLQPSPRRPLIASRCWGEPTHNREDAHATGTAWSSIGQHGSMNQGESGPASGPNNRLHAHIRVLAGALSGVPIGQLK